MYDDHEPIPYVGLISRPKLVGPGEHVGASLGDGRVAHLGMTGAAIVSFDDFSRGHLVKKMGVPVPAELHSQILARAKMSLGRTSAYHLLLRNCEHYATWLITGKPKSRQVNGLMLLLLVGLVAFGSN